MRALDLVDGWPADSAAAGVLSCDRGSSGVVVHPGVWLRATVGDVDRSFPWASVTKLCTALAVLVAVEERTLALDEPAGPPGATVAHLLAHASGLAPDVPEAVARPGLRRIYSNAGYEVLAELLASRAAMPFADYLSEAVFAPLGMWGAHLPPCGSAASGVEGGLSDLLALGAELLAPTILAPVTLATATGIAFPGLAGVLPGFGRQDPCDWGLGFEIRDGKRPHWTGARCSPSTFGHFGRTGTFLWVDPEAGAACAVLTDRPFGPWAAEAWPLLSDAVIDELAALPDGSRRG